MASQLTFEVYSKKQWIRRRMRFVTIWYWHLVATNSLGVEIICQGETNGYFNRSDCEGGIEIVRHCMFAETKYLTDYKLKKIAK